jgi:hypothetical protein
MASDNINQRNNSQHAKGRRNFNIEDKDISEITRLVERNKNRSIASQAFSVKRTNVHRRFGYNEYIYTTYQLVQTMLVHCQSF